MSELNLNFPTWMKTPQTEQLFDIFGDRLRYVGGCVRNALMDGVQTDIDMACQLTPFDVQKELEAHGIKVYPTGLDHGTLTAVIDKIPFEITTLRRDVETDGRRAVVAFTDDWSIDAHRRDFTINALYADRSGKVYDYTGQGIDDLKARRIRFVGDATRRIGEDQLRVLRFFRFCAFYGRTNIDTDAVIACKDAATLIAKLSRERITQEVLKLLSAPNPDAVLAVMFENSILPPLFHVGFNLDVVTRYGALNGRNPLTRLAILAGFDEAHVALFEKRLIFSRSQRRDVIDIIKGVNDLTDVSENLIKQLIYKNDNEVALEVYLARTAKYNGVINEGYLEILKTWEAPTCPLSGDDLISQGHKPGPELGQKLKDLEADWLKTL